jgi:hypothetical protein
MAISRLHRTLTLSLCACSVVFGFSPIPRPSCRKGQSLTVLDMAKKMRNAQAELAKKMELAKKKQAGNQVDDQGSETERLTDKEVKEKNDRLRFEELLKKQSTSLNSVSSDGYLSKQQEEEEIDAFSKSDFRWYRKYLLWDFPFVADNDLRIL